MTKFPYLAPMELDNGNIVNLFEEGDHFPSSFRLQKEGSLDDDMLLLLDKHRGKPSEAVVRFLLDCLVTFRHNYNQLKDGVFVKDFEVLDKDNDPNLKNDMDTVLNKFYK